MSVSATPEFIDGPNGRLFVLTFKAEQARGHIVYLPPFGEEMNRCRHLAAAQARQFAAAGYNCTIVDLSGTGDSQGALEQASWSAWQADANAVIDWCRNNHDLPIILWGLRLGATLALEMTARRRDCCAGAILWQPVTNGKTFLTQVLRARIAYLSGAGLPPETSDEIRQRLATGEDIEVAGYVLGGQLAADIDSLKTDGLPELPDLRIHWLQQTSRPADAPSAAVQKVVDRLLALGASVDVHLFQAPQLWQLSERADGQPLLDATNALELG